MNRAYLLLFITALLQSCAIWEVGEDPAGKNYRAEAELIDNALIKYKNDTGVLPIRLKELIPSYLGKLPSVAEKGFYSAKEGSLTYTYSPSWPQSGKISCGSVIGSGKWSCNGYI